MPKFDLLRRSSTKKFYWWEDRGGSYFQPDSEMEFPKTQDHEVIETSDSLHYRDLDHTKTGLVDSESGAGWLSPEGKFYPCDFQGHSRVAEYILKVSDDQLERGGWVHVAGPEARLWTEYHHPTEAQRDWARQNGHRFQGDEVPVSSGNPESKV